MAADIELDTVFEPADVADLADGIMIDGVYTDLRDCVEVLHEAGIKHGTIVAAVKMAAIRLGEPADGPRVKAVISHLRKLATEKHADAKIAKGSMSWKDD
jgi:hypothetical protein